jgi:hypothetical protein
MIEYIPIGPTSGNLKAICATCERIMHRRARRAALATIMPGFTIQFAGEQPRLIERPQSSPNCVLAGTELRR